MNALTPVSGTGAIPAMGGGARLLLRRMQELMAGDEGGNARLQRIVTLVANTMLSDECSIYLRDHDGSFLLVAASGGRAEAIGILRATPSEGLIGVVAQTASPFVLTPASTRQSLLVSEIPYRGFMAVPILRGGQVVGVLAVHNRSGRVYDKGETEVLQTVAMVLAETAARDGEALLAGSVERQTILQGRVLNDGFAAGSAHLHHPVVPVARFLAVDPGAETTRLLEALDALRRSIDAMLSGSSMTLFGESREVLETYRLFAHDTGWETRLVEVIRSGLTAEAAVERVRREHLARLGSARDPYLRERLHDLEDLESRLLRHLSGDRQALAPAAGCVLVAGRIGPAERLDYHRRDLAGVVLEEAGPASHVAIIARALAVPTLGSVQGLTGIVHQGDDLVIDTASSCVHVRPGEEFLANARARVSLTRSRDSNDSAHRLAPAVSTDGVRVTMLMNAGLALDLDHLDQAGADGVGMFRTEFQFMTATGLPRLSEQIASYRDILSRTGDRELTFRTLDLGGDKLARFIRRRQEANPAMGMRAVRIFLRHPYFARRQIRALMRAAAGQKLSIMFPMVASVEEFDAARALVDAELAWASRFGHPIPETLRVGTMIEVPSLALSIRHLAGKSDFLSVGTNDLIQFHFGADRHNDQVAARYDMLSQPMLDLLERMFLDAQKCHIPISVCGECAGNGLEAAVLIALGYRRLSMPAGRIGAVKRIIRSLNIAELASELASLRARSTSNIRNALLKHLRHSRTLN